MSFEIVEGVQFDSANPIHLAILIVAAAIIVVGLVSVVVSIWLSIRYIKFNHTENSIGKTGEQVAREILDRNGCENIKVKCTGSFLFGNSYSHWFKKVRLRRLTWKKSSLSSLGMAAQKSCLAVLDKENDPAMKGRIAFGPIMMFGPFAFIPLIVIGALIDIFLFSGTGICTIIFSALGFGFYIAAFVVSLLTLKTERRAQERAYEILKKDNLATDEEIEKLHTLFHLYNIQYVNDMILSMLEILLRVLMIVAKVQGSSTSSSNN